jgi:WD40 repeat protein
MAMWLINEVKIVPKAAEKYATLLYEAEVGSIGRLKKKLTKNKNFLIYLKFDEDDIEDIVSALFPEKEQATKNLILPDLNTIPTLPDRNYEISAQFRGHSGGIWSVIELADGTICSGSADSSIRIWNVSTLACVKILGGHTNSVGRLHFQHCYYNSIVFI